MFGRSRPIRELLHGREAALALTASQMFLGALSLGIAMHRGTEVYSEFHHESLLAHSNYGASSLAGAHARSANVVVNDNTVMTAIMGPRFGVEADNITMDANAAIACPQCPHGPLCGLVCRPYQENKSRALAKLAWVRAKQATLWGSLGKLSGEVDRLASMQAGNTVAEELARLDSRVKVRFDDPAREKDIWGGANTAVSCKLAAKDIVTSPVLGHAFPTLIPKNLLEGLPRVLVAAMPEKLCAITDPFATSEHPDVGTAQLGEIREVANKTRDDCRDLEKEMRCSIAAAKGQPGACQDHAAPEVEDMSYATTKEPTFSRKAQRFISCQVGTTKNPLRTTSAAAGGYSYVNAKQELVTCAFDEDECQDKLLTENSNAYLREKLGLPTIVKDLAASLGGSETRAPSTGAGSEAADFCACTYTERPIDETVIGISDGVRKIASFGAAAPSEELRRRRDYRACGKWYFPDGRGEFAGVPRDEQPFVGAWKWALASKCPGGR